MEDLSYIIGLGFSGTDIWRAIYIGFFAAMLVNKKRNIAVMAFWALLVDRCLWPLTHMALSGATQSSISASFNAMIETLSLDLGLYVVRYAGLMFIMFLFISIRKRIHRPRSDKSKGKFPKPSFS